MPKSHPHAVLTNLPFVHAGCRRLLRELPLQNVLLAPKCSGVYTIDYTPNHPGMVYSTYAYIDP